MLSGTSGVSVASDVTLKLTRDDGAFTFNRNLSGAGAVQINPHSVSGAASLGVTLSGDSTGFTGQMTLLAPVTGTCRLTSVTPANLGGATIAVESGAQVYTVLNATYGNAITIAGTGFADSAANIGALRLENGSNWADWLRLAHRYRAGDPEFDRQRLVERRRARRHAANGRRWRAAGKRRAGHGAKQCEHRNARLERF